MFERTRNGVSTLLRGQRIYVMHVLGLLAPGVSVPVVKAHQTQPSSLDGWGADDLSRMIEEGRRQLDRQLTDLERIRSRGQWLFTLGVTLSAALAGVFTTTRPNGPVLWLWLATAAVLVYAVAGAGSIITVRADFGAIDTAVLSESTPPVTKALATSYSRMLATGENTVATRLTVFRQAVLFVIIGGYLGLIAVLVRQ
jgi:hypothetical protein